MDFLTQRPGSRIELQLHLGPDGYYHNEYGHRFDALGRPKNRGVRGAGGQEAHFRGYWAGGG